MSLNRTTDFGMRFAIDMQKQLNTVPADLYGGANTVALGANDEMLLDEVTISDDPEFHVDEANNGTQIARGQDLVAVMVPISAKGKIWARGAERLLVSALGYESVAGPTLHTTSRYARVIALSPIGKDQRTYTTAEQAAVVSGYDADDRINVYQTVGRLMGPSEEIVKNVSWKSVKFSCEQKGPLMIEVSGTGEKLTRDATKATSPNWSVLASSQSTWFAMRHCTAKLGAPSSQAAISLLDFSVSAELGQAEGQVPTGTGNSGLAQAEPVSTGMTEVTVEGTIYLHNTDQLKTWEQAATELCLSLDFLRADSDRLVICIPSMKLVSVEADGADGGSIKFTAKAFLPTGSDPFATERTFGGSPVAVPTVLGSAVPMYVVLDNTISTNWMRAV